MSLPTTSIGFSKSTPAAPAGYQIAQPQTDNGSPQQLVDFAVPSTGGVAAKTASYTLQASDCGLLIVANSASALTFTLPAAVPFSQWQVTIANLGAGALSVLPGGSLDLDGATSALVVGQAESISIATDGSNYFSARGTRTILTPVTLRVASGAALTAGAQNAFAQVDFAGTIVGWSLTADQAGSVSVDVWKAASSAPPSAPAIPTSANKISATAGPSLSSAQSASENAGGLTGWTTAVAAYDVFGFNIASASTVTAITLQIWIQRT